MGGNLCSARLLSRSSLRGRPPPEMDLRGSNTPQELPIRGLLSFRTPLPHKPDAPFRRAGGKMRKSIWTAALAALLWTGSFAAAAQAPETQSGRIDPAVWKDESAGTVRHIASDVAFPAEIAGFRRFKLNQVDARDVALNYRLGEGDAADLATIFLFGPGKLPEHRWKGSLAAFGTMSPMAFVWALGPFDVAAATPLHGRKGTFKTGIGPDTHMDYLYFFELGDWTVKVRATFSKVTDIKQEERVDTFVRALPWDRILAANGGCNGSACVKPAFEAFDSHPMEAMLAPLLAATFKFDRGDERKLPVVARPQMASMGETEIRKSDKEPLVYVVEVKGLGAYRLVKLNPATARLITEGYGRLSIDRDIYGLFIDTGGKEMLMPRLFHGEPTPDAFAATVSELILRPTTDPFISVSKTAAAMPD
jgi:hypothetical protein